ncbi:MAG: hypothetical protein KDA24_25810 [Deltaproteobacteria bacterium]|nr:hypothetical protein [Deltaproteobacteria bacterium]
MRRTPLVFALATTLVIGVGGCSKVRTLAKTSLEASQPLTVTFDSDLSQCAEHACLIGFAESIKDDKGISTLSEEGRLVRLYGDGSYKVFKKGERPEEPEQEEAPENWQETDEKSKEHWVQKAEEKTMGNAIEEVAAGTLAEVDGKKVLELAADLLPANDFVLYTNGHFGALYDGSPLGSPEDFGVTKISR